MAIDFSKLKSASTSETLTNPREIFVALPDKVAKYGYLRDVQAEVLDQWYIRRNTRDLRLKMNTGGGKTLVGLLMLKSCLNESKRPAVYVAPTPYLALQVLKEAADLGLSTEEDPRALAVARGRSILVTNIHVLINGKSKFGVAPQVAQIPIGSLVIDDVHACLATAEQQFTLTVDAPHDCYDQILKLFRVELAAQSSSSLLDVENEEPYKFMLVPYWTWQSKIKDVEGILHEHRDDDEFMFHWPLIREHLRFCRCVIGAGKIEISPRCLPVSAIPSFIRAERRIFMSATFADDSVLVTDFDAQPDDIKTAIAPKSASDIGDRMILVPKELTPSISDDDIRDLVVKLSSKHNVVVIVPSHYRAGYWKDAAQIVLAAETLEEGVSKLKEGHVGLVVIVNRYDGIDLPDKACRLLILDGVPDARRAIDRIEQGYLYGTALEITKSIQQIEQGMGRGVRASDDYCAVILMGGSLTGQLFARNGISQFSETTRVQFDLCESLAEQVRGKGIGEIEVLINLCLDRNKDWVKAAKAALVHVKYSIESSGLDNAVARRISFDAATSTDYEKAIRSLQERIDNTSEQVVKGWLMSELAEYTHPVDAVKAQQLTKAAHTLNRQLLRPQVGINYQRLSPLTEDQAIASLNYIKDRFNSGNEVLVAANAIAEDLAYRPNSFRRFHGALRDAGLLLGFGAQLPESEFGSGPDVLWAVGDRRYLVIECKNEATTDKVSKKDCDQLAGSMNWFRGEYDNTCTATPVLAHPSRVFIQSASPPPGTRVVTAAKLLQLRDALLAFCLAVSKLAGFGTVNEVAEQLAAQRLASGALLSAFTEDTTKSK